MRVILLLLLLGKRQGQGQPPPLPLRVPRAPSSTPVGELRTGRIGGAVTTFEELRETLTAWLGQVAPEQEGIVAEALRRAAFDQGQFRGQSAAKASPAPSGAAASAPAVLPSASDAEPIVVQAQKSPTRFRLFFFEAESARAPGVTAGQGAASSASQLPQFGSPQTDRIPGRAPPVTQGKASFKGSSP